MLRYLIDALGFNTAVRLVATLVAVTAIFSAIFATPNPAHVHSHPQSYRQLKTWIDTDAFRNKAFCWFSAAVAFLFFGFYPVFFNLEEVSKRKIPAFTMYTDEPSGQLSTATEPGMAAACQWLSTPRLPNPFKPSGSSQS